MHYDGWERWAEETARMGTWEGQAVINTRWKLLWERPLCKFQNMYVEICTAKGRFEIQSLIFWEWTSENVIFFKFNIHLLVIWANDSFWTQVSCSSLLQCFLGEDLTGDRKTRQHWSKSKCVCGGGSDWPNKNFAVLHWVCDLLWKRLPSVPISCFSALAGVTGSLSWGAEACHSTTHQFL